MKNTLRNIAFAGALTFSSLSCTPTNITKKPDKVFAQRVEYYKMLLQNEKIGVVVDHSQYKDVQGYLKTGKVPDYVTNPKAKRPTEQPKVKVVTVKRPGISGRLETTAKDAKWSISPYAFQKRKFKKDDDDIGPYNGAGLRVTRNLNKKVGVSGKLEVDSASDNQKTGISRNELKSNGVTTGVEVFVTPVKTKNFELGVHAGAVLRLEKNTGYMQTLDAERELDKTEIMGGWEAGLRAKFTKPNKRFGAYVGAQLEQAGDSGIGYRVEGGVGFRF